MRYQVPIILSVVIEGYMAPTTETKYASYVKFKMAAMIIYK